MKGEERLLTVFKTAFILKLTHAGVQGSLPDKYYKNIKKFLVKISGIIIKVDDGRENLKEITEENLREAKKSKILPSISDEEFTSLFLYTLTKVT